MSAETELCSFHTVSSRSGKTLHNLGNRNVVLQGCVSQPGVTADHSLNTVCAVKPSTHSITLGKGLAARTGGEGREQTL